MEGLGEALEAVLVVQLAVAMEAASMLRVVRTALVVSLEACRSLERERRDSLKEVVRHYGSAVAAGWGSVHICSSQALQMEAGCRARNHALLVVS